jgi:ABC-2 type transport system ATP-binding protein
MNRGAPPVAIETRLLTKFYGKARGCRDINLTVPAGTIFGFMGPNGAGKSTVVKLLVGLLAPTAGQGTIFGHPLGSPAANAQLGFVPEHYRLPDWPVVTDLLAYYGRLCGLRGDDLRVRCVDTLAQVGLSDAAGRRVGALSNGMRQRLALGAALLHRPRLLILDEPTAALDPLGRRFVRSLLQELRGQGITIFLNSHLIGELEQLCDELAIIRDGSVVAAGTVAALTGARVDVTLRAEPMTDGLITALGALGSVAHLPGGRLVVTLNEPDHVPLVAAAVHGAGASLYELTPHSRSLEDLFVDLVTVPGEEVSAGG